MRAFGLVVLVSTLFFTSLAVADLRVTVLFDRDGHRSFQVFRTGIIAPLEIRSLYDPIATSRSLASSDRGARVLWYDIGGNQVFSEMIRDPRIVHAPVADRISDGQVEYAIRDQGIYRLRGPNSAVSVLVSLPALQSAQMRLPAEQWTFDLKP